MNNADVFFPQGCGQLSDIGYWEGLAAGVAISYEGHPAPVISFTDDTVRLDFVAGEFDDPFEPPPPVRSLAISRAALLLAVNQANQELQQFAQRLRALNETANLGVPAIDKLLIWEDEKHE